MKQQICENCHQEFTPSRGPSKSRRQKYCSNQCRAFQLSGSNHPAAKTQIIGGGYRQIWVGKEKILEHRHVAQESLGRKLLDSEFVHHINRDKLDNRPENLQVVASNAEHRALHATGFRSETHKQCTACREIKLRSAFDAGNKNHPKGDPNFTECKQCRSAYFAKRYAEGKTTVQRKGRVKWAESGHTECASCHTVTHAYRSRGLCSRCYYQSRKAAGLSC